jgi:hypothetical protein
MGEQASVTSIEVLEMFRASLIIFVNRAHGIIDEARGEIRRKRLWVQSDQRLYWEGEIRRRKRMLEQARQELLTARLSSLRDDLYPQVAAARKAELAFAEAEEKLRKVKQWSRNFESCADPLSKKLESLRQVLDDEMPKAISRLLQTQKTLESYTERTSAGNPRTSLPDDTEETVLHTANVGHSGERD